MANDRDPLKFAGEQFVGPPQASEFDGLTSEQVEAMKQLLARYDGAQTYINGRKGNGIAGAHPQFAADGEAIMAAGGIPTELLERMGRFRTWVEYGSVPENRAPVAAPDADANRAAFFAPGADKAKVWAEQAAAMKRDDYANRQFMYNETLGKPKPVPQHSEVPLPTIQQTARAPAALPADMPDDGDDAYQTMGRKLLKALLTNSAAATIKRKQK